MSARAASVANRGSEWRSSPGLTNTSKVSGGSVPLAQTFVLLLIGLSPFWLSPPMNTGLLGIDSLSVANLLPVVTFCIVIFTSSNLRRPTDRLGQAARILFFCYLLVFAVAFARSVPHLARFSAMGAGVPNNLKSYIDSRFVVQALMALQFLYVLGMFRTGESMFPLFTALSASLFILSCVIIVAVLSNPAVLNTPLRFGIADLSEAVLGTHYNGASEPYAIAAPLLAFMAIKRGGLWALNYTLAFVALLFLESRTALVAFVGMSVLTLIVCGKARALVAAVPMIGLAALSAVGPILFAIFSTGFKHGSFSLFFFLSGRDQIIWLPLMLEWWRNSSRFWFGAGEYGILTSDMLLTGKMLAVFVAHNAYLEFFLDNGVVGLLGLLAALALFLRWAWRTGLRLRTQLYWVLFLCLVSYLVTGFTGHRFFPESENMFVFTLLAALVNIARLKQARLHPGGGQPLSAATPQLQQPAHENPLH